MNSPGNVRPPSRAQYLWYMAGVTAFVVPGGIQTILFPWLIAVQLDLGADLLGLAQMSMQVPALLLILLGGLLADRVDARKILINAHFLAALPAAGLALVLYTTELTYFAMILYALATGTILAFVQPARDSILNRIAMGGLQQTVTVTMGLQFGAQIIGFGIASGADTTGPIPLLIVHSSLMLVGAFASSRLAPAPPQFLQRESGFTQIKDGLGLVWSSERMRPAILLLTIMSAFYGGTFVVLNPIIVRDLYAGEAAQISLSFAAFMLGTITMTVLLVALGGIQRHGRGLTLAIVVGGSFLLIAATGVSFVLYLGCLFCWGMCGAVAMSMSRTIMQESAPDNYRARVMSIFSLANMGGMPIGAVIMGFTATWFGPLTGLVVAASVAMLTGVVVALVTRIWHLEQL